jgi:hypothetical protein
LVVACGGKGEAGSVAGSTSTETGDDNPPRPEERCRGGKTEPFDLKTVIDVARRHRIMLYPQPDCQPDPTIVSQAANILQYGPHQNYQHASEIQEREGAVTCLLRARPGLGPKTVERNRYSGDEETHFSLHNIVCIIYPEPDKTDEQLLRLEKTMNELEDRAKATQ